MTYWAAIVAMILSLAAECPNPVQQTTEEKGEFTLHLLLHPIGKESYEIVRRQDGGLVMNSHLEFSDRGRKRTVASVLRMKGDFTPEGLEVNGTSGNSTTSDAVEVHESVANIHEAKNSRDIPLPDK